ncbi:MAG: hypothetical protein LQ350_008678 [Teloschistes chrysophthalmus]|nr:MAG: hypothetical protein LQ350_008678 [Niorma chrysophthalma]
MAQEREYELYHYTPSLPAAVIFVVVFFALMGIHTYRMIKNRLWFCIPFVVGGLFETIGYIGRAIGHSQPKTLGPYLIQTLFILVAPALFAATIYMTLNRLMCATNSASLSLIRANWVTKIFVIGDVFTFFIQAGGGGIMASADAEKVKLGQNVVLGGLFLQILIFGFFVLVAAVFHVRLRKQRKELKGVEVPVGVVEWEKTLVVLYLVSGLIMARNIVRVVEFIGGREGPLLTVEWTIYVFDALIMAATMAVWLAPYVVALKRGKVPEGSMELGHV